MSIDVLAMCPMNANEVIAPVAALESEPREPLSRKGKAHQRVFEHSGSHACRGCLAAGLIWSKSTCI